MNMHTKHMEIKEKYAPLVRALRTHGWQVHQEVASVVIGHRATALNLNKDAMQIIGITDQKNPTTHPERYARRSHTIRTNNSQQHQEETRDAKQETQQRAHRTCM